MDRIYASRPGVTSLATVILIGSIIVELATIGAFLIYLLNTSSFGFRIATQAFIAAQSGIEEGILRLLRDPSFSGVTMGSDFFPAMAPAVSVTVVVSVPGSGQFDVRTITAVGTSLTRQRRLEARVERDTTTNSLRVLSLKEF